MGKRLPSVRKLENAVAVSGVFALGVPKPGCFKPGCLQFLRGSALLRSFADLRLRSLALICYLSRAFACFCVRPRLERPHLGTADCKSSGGKFQENSGKIAGHALNFRTFGHRKRQTCRKHWVHTALHLVPTFRAGVFRNLQLPFVQNHSGNASKIIFLCICTCYEIKIICPKQF